MAKGKKTGGRDFKPGVVTNPLGGGAHNPNLRRVKRLTKEAVAEIGELILNNDLEALQAVVDSAAKSKGGQPNPTYDPKKHSVLEIWFAAIAVKAIQKGDPLALNAILNRITGKVPEEIKHSGIPGASNMGPVIVLPGNGRDQKN